MDSGGLLVSHEDLNRLYLFFIYTAVGLSAFRWLMPRLSFLARWLAIGMLAAQILVIIVSQTIQPESTFEALLWELRHEWNVPSTLATAQLATVGGVMILLCALSHKKSAWYRMIFFGLGLLFLFLAWDEFYKVHEQIPQWELKYAILGGIAALSITIVLVRSPGPERVWHICLLFGLAFSALGAILFERLSKACDQLLFLRFEGCFKFYVWEESSEFLGIWLALVAVLGIFSAIRPLPSPLARGAFVFFPLLWLILLIASTFLPRVELLLVGTAADVHFDTDVRLKGYRLDNSLKHAGDTYPVQLYSSARQANYYWLGYSIHLVDQVSGESIARRNLGADWRHSLWGLGPMYEPIFGQWIDTAIPASAPANRAMWVVLSLWRPQDDKFSVKDVLVSDLQTLGSSQVVLGEVVLRAQSAAASTAPPLAMFDNGFALQEVDIPATAKAGEALSMSFFWRAEVEDDDNFIQFLHLGHEDSGEWFVYDQEPLGPRLPTRLWYAGLADSETWQAPLPANLAPGRYTVFTGLYRTSDKERVIARAADGTAFLDARIPLGSLIVSHD